MILLLSNGDRYNAIICVFHCKQVLLIKKDSCIGFVISSCNRLTFVVGLTILMRFLELKVQVCPLKV